MNNYSVNKTAVIVCGCRDFGEVEIDRELVRERIDMMLGSVKNEIVLIQGGAAGVDTIARQWAIDRGVKYFTYFAEWKKYGKQAGPIRNERMLKGSKLYQRQYIIAFWDGVSKGTRNMIETAIDGGVDVFIIPIEDGNARPKMIKTAEDLENYVDCSMNAYCEYLENIEELNTRTERFATREERWRGEDLEPEVWDRDYYQKEKENGWIEYLENGTTIFRGDLSKYGVFGWC